MWMSLVLLTWDCTWDSVIYAPCPIVSKNLIHKKSRFAWYQWDRWWLMYALMPTTSMSRKLSLICGPPIEHFCNMIPLYYYIPFSYPISIISHHVPMFYLLFTSLSKRYKYHKITYTCIYIYDTYICVYKTYIYKTHTHMYIYIRHIYMYTYITYIIYIYTHIYI